MRKNGRYILFVFLLSLVFAGCVLGADNRILLVGDSITEGVKSSDSLGFRDALYEKLLEEGYPFCFVGYPGEPPYRGHFRAGALIEQFYSGPGGDSTFSVVWDMKLDKPHIAVIHLGTNDIYSLNPVTPYTKDGGLSFTGGTIAGRLANLILYMLKWHNGEMGDHLRYIFVSQIIPNLVHPTKVNALNAEIARFVQDANNGLLPKIPAGVLRLIDQNTSFDTETMMDEDGVHPNDDGYEHMADVIFEALQYLPMHLVRVSEEARSGRVWNELSSPLTVRVTDGYGSGVPGVDVHFEVTDGDAVLVDSQPVQSDDSGLASARVLLQDAGTSTIAATSEGLTTVAFDVTAVVFVRLEGAVTYYAGGLPIPGVRVTLVEGGEATDTTNSEGCFGFENLPFGSRVTLQSQKGRWEDVPASTILSYDAALAARYVVGLDDPSPQERLAADVDEDGVVSVYDALQIARHAVGYDSPENVHVGGWRFLPGFLSYDSLIADQSGQDFAGVLLGDVHGGWSVPDLPKEGFGIAFVASPSFGTGTDRFLTVSVEVKGEGVLSCDGVCRYDPDVFQFLGADRTKRTRTFRLLHREEGDAVRFGLSGTEPSAEGSILLMTFRVLEGREKGRLTFQDVYVNDTCLGKREVDVSSEEKVEIPARVYVAQSFPNPFNETTLIEYQIPRTDRVRFRVYNALGQEVVVLVDGKQLAGSHRVVWDGRDERGMVVSSGIYFYELSVGDERRVGRMGKIR